MTALRTLAQLLLMLLLALDAGAAPVHSGMTVANEERVATPADSTHIAPPCHEAGTPDEQPVAAMPDELSSSTLNHAHAAHDPNICGAAQCQCGCLPASVAMQARAVPGSSDTPDALMVQAAAAPFPAIAIPPDLRPPIPV